MSFERGGTCVLAWKKRDGLFAQLGGWNMMQKKKKTTWEQRWIVLADDCILYYNTGDEDRLGEADFQARGCIDLTVGTCRVEVSSQPSHDAPTPHEIDIVHEVPVVTAPPTGGGVAVVDGLVLGSDKTATAAAAAAQQQKRNKSNNNTKTTRWKLCFETQQSLMEFLEKAHAALETTGQLQEKDASRFEHDFQPADHIYRWEMIVCPPVIYPIQIHGIVLEGTVAQRSSHTQKVPFMCDVYGMRHFTLTFSVFCMFCLFPFPPYIAGRNCVVVADFGLTGYGKRSAVDKFHHANDDDNDPTNKALHNQVVAAFKKLRPNSDQRLHITTLTDPMDLRKWHKAHYDESSFSSSFQTPESLNKLADMLGKVKILPTKLHSNLQDELILTTSHSHSGASASGTSADDEDDNNSQQHPIVKTLSDDAADNFVNFASHVQNDDKVDSPTTSMRSRTNSQDPSSVQASQPKGGFSQEYSKQRQEDHPLPKADPKEIVLSRANFLLEFDEERLPPYHVFYSNSECLAVWCKTGRWSTLQTAVFLSSNAIGGAKSATVATLGVAAAHAILAPVVAVGGLIWVSAPMVILKKSRDKWEHNTQLMTDLYWQEWAPPSIFVCAIEHWSEVGYTTQQAKRRQQQLLLEQQAQQQQEHELAAQAAGTNGNAKDDKQARMIKKYSSDEILQKNQQQRDNNNNTMANGNGTVDKEVATNSNNDNDQKKDDETQDKECKSDEPCLQQES